MFDLLFVQESLLDLPGGARLVGEKFHPRALIV